MDLGSHSSSFLGGDELANINKIIFISESIRNSKLLGSILTFHWNIFILFLVAYCYLELCSEMMVNLVDYLTAEVCKCVIYGGGEERALFQAVCQVNRLFCEDF